MCVTVGSNAMTHVSLEADIGFGAVGRPLGPDFSFIVDLRDPKSARLHSEPQDSSLLLAPGQRSQT